MVINSDLTIDGGMAIDPGGGEDRGGLAATGEVVALCPTYGITDAATNPATDVTGEEAGGAVGS